MTSSTRTMTAIVIGLLAATAAWPDPGRYLEREEFLAAAFGERDPAQHTLWLDGELRASIEDILGHSFSLLRVRYWAAGGDTAWILDEIGKEEPITIGVTVDDGAIGMVRILEFRESRGFEVRYPFFTDQFIGARLEADRSIDRSIDGITGATLSVGAVSRVARVALLLHEQATAAGSPPSDSSS